MPPDWSESGVVVVAPGDTPSVTGCWWPTLPNASLCRFLKQQYHQTETQRDTHRHTQTHMVSRRCKTRTICPVFVYVGFVSLPNSQRQEMGGEQRWDEEEENLKGEDPPLHYVRVPHTQGALLFGVLEHKVSGWREGRTDRQ